MWRKKLTSLTSERRTVLDKAASPVPLTGPTSIGLADLIKMNAKIYVTAVIYMQYNNSDDSQQNK